MELIKCMKCWDEKQMLYRTSMDEKTAQYCMTCFYDKLHYEPGKILWQWYHKFIKDKQDMVNHPDHYTQWNIEVIDFILDQKLWYLESNIVKYICRYRYKNWVEDLLKAEWYLQKLIKSFDKMK